jgi:hypothetical protein
VAKLFHLLLKQPARKVTGIFERGSRFQRSEQVGQLIVDLVRARDSPGDLGTDQGCAPGAEAVDGGLDGSFGHTQFDRKLGVRSSSIAGQRWLEGFEQACLPGPGALLAQPVERAID